MKRAPSQGGFTIVETLIVVAVSGILLASAVLLVAGQQRKVEFTQAVNDIRSVIDQTISEINSGYYPNGGNIRCVAAGSNITITSTTGTAQGENTGCIFLGKVMQFGVQDTNPQQYVIHSVAALRANTGTLASAAPRAVDVTNTRVTKELRNGLQAVAMRYVVGATRTNIGAMAFVNGLGNYGGNGQLLSGAQQMSVVPVTASGTVPNTNVSSVVAAINSQLRNADGLLNPSGGIEICFEGGARQWGLITIGGNGRNLSVKLDIKSTDCRT